MIISWEKLKLKAIEAAGLVPASHALIKMAPYALQMCEYDRVWWHLSAEELRTEALRIITQWDIRRIKDLIDIFPSVIPPGFENITPTCYMSETTGEWLCEFITTNKRTNG